MSCPFLIRFAREKTLQHDFKNQFLGIENSYLQISSDRTKDCKNGEET